MRYNELQWINKKSSNNQLVCSYSLEEKIAVGIGYHRSKKARAIELLGKRVRQQQT